MSTCLEHLIYKMQQKMLLQSIANLLASTVILDTLAGMNILVIYFKLVKHQEIYLWINSL